MDFFRRVEGAAHAFVQSGVGQVARDVCHFVGKPRPRVVVDVVGVELRAGMADEAFQHVVKTLTPAIGVGLRPGDADQSELLGQHFAARKIVKRRHHETLGQIASRAENHHGAGIGRLRLVPRRARDHARGGRRRPQRNFVKHGGAARRRLKSLWAAG